MHDLSHTNSLPKCSQSPGLAQATATSRNSIQVSNTSIRDSSTWVISCHLPGCKLIGSWNGKWSRALMWCGQPQQCQPLCQRPSPCLFSMVSLYPPMRNHCFHLLRAPFPEEHGTWEKPRCSAVGWRLPAISHSWALVSRTLKELDLAAAESKDDPTVPATTKTPPFQHLRMKSQSCAASLASLPGKAEVTGFASRSWPGSWNQV